MEKFYYVTRAGAAERGEISGKRGHTFNQKITFAIPEQAEQPLRTGLISEVDQDEAEKKQAELDAAGAKEAKVEADKQKAEIDAAKAAAARAKKVEKDA